MQLFLAQVAEIKEQKRIVPAIHLLNISSSKLDGKNSKKLLKYNSGVNLDGLENIDFANKVLIYQFILSHEHSSKMNLAGPIWLTV